MIVMIVCLHVLVLQQFGNLSRVYPASCPITAEINSHDPHDWIRGKLDGIMFLSTVYTVLLEITLYEYSQNNHKKVATK